MANSIDFSAASEGCAQRTSRQDRSPWLGLAPMEGVTDFATRLWIAQTAAPDEATTPFLRVTKDYPAKRISANFLPEIHLSKAHGVVPCTPQLMASETGDLIRIAESFLQSVPFVDINCGCPSPTVVGHGAGSGLLQNPDHFHRYLNEILSALGPRRVSVKMRVGFSNESEFSRLLDVISDFPLARLTIHGRTRADRYTGLARWSHVEAAARQLSCPVVGSGDVVDLLSFENRVRMAPLVSGVIVGRGALRNPWLFQQLRQKNQPLMIDSDRFRSCLLLFVLLQEANASAWERLFSLVREGFFATENRILFANEQEFANALAFQVFSTGREGMLLPGQWPITRTSLARGKMLWNYLRSGLEVSPELSVAMLRAPDWPTFLSALERFLVAVPAHDVGIGYRQEWDWVFSGAGAPVPSAKETP